LGALSLLYEDELAAGDVLCRLQRSQPEALWHHGSFSTSDRLKRKSVAGKLGDIIDSL
jgi:hypothetical protein